MTMEENWARKKKSTQTNQASLYEQTNHLTLLLVVVTNYENYV